MISWGKHWKNLMLCFRAGTSKARHTSGSSQSGRSRERTESNNRFFHATTTSALMLLASKGENNSAWKKSLLDLKIFIRNMYVVGLSACSNIHAYLVSSFTIWRHNFSLLAFVNTYPSYIAIWANEFSKNDIVRLQ